MVSDYVIGAHDGARPFNVSANGRTALQPFDAAFQCLGHRLLPFSRAASAAIRFSRSSISMALAYPETSDERSPASLGAQIFCYLCAAQAEGCSFGTQQTAE